MKKIILLFFLFIPSFCVHAQSLDAESQALDSLLKTGRLSKAQVTDLKRKWDALIRVYKYPELSVNSFSGEIEISDILRFENLDKKVIFQRCLQWISINYGNLVYSDIESGKIVANGLIDLSHYVESRAGFGSRVIHPVQTSTNYTFILTLKDNKVKYTITNIIYNFSDYSETVNEISMPINTLFPVISQDQGQWVRYITVLNASTDKFSLLKKSLIGYINNAENDYNF